MATSARGRPVKVVDFKQLAGGSEEEFEKLLQENMDGISMKSGASKKSKSRTPHKVKSSITADKKRGKTPKKIVMDEPDSVKEALEFDEESAQDSREGDFSESDEDVLSIGRNSVRLQELDRKIQEAEPTLGERYNEFKVAQGVLERLEDHPLPDNLEEEEVFLQVSNDHTSQLKATVDRTKRASRRLEMMEMREKIILEKENSQRMEWEAERKERQKELRRQQIVIESKKQQLEMERLRAQEEAQKEEYALIMNELRKNKQRKGQTPQRNSNKRGNPNTIDVSEDDNNSGVNGIIMQDYTQSPIDKVDQWMTKQTGRSIPIVPEGMHSAEVNELQNHAKIIIEKKHKRSGNTRKAR